MADASRPPQGGRGLSPAVALAAIAYFGGVFCVGFAVGALRVLVVTPMTGELLAVSLEAPIMLAVSWIACGWCLRLFPVEPAPAPRVVMGVVAFALLMAAEFAVGVLVFARDPITALETWASPAGAVGLSSQIGFAVIPYLRGRFARPQSVLGLLGTGGAASAPPLSRLRRQLPARGEHSGP